MKKLLALILTLCMVFTLAGCGEDAELYNTWEGEMDMVPLVKELFAYMGETQGMDEEFVELMTPDEFTFKMILEIDENGEYTLEFDEDSMIEAAEKYCDDVMDDVIDYYIEKAEEQGMSKEELFENNGMDSEEELGEYLKELLILGLTQAVNTEDNSQSGEYELDGNTLILDGTTKIEFEIDGDDMTGNMILDNENITAKCPIDLTVQ